MSVTPPKSNECFVREPQDAVLYLEVLFMAILGLRMNRFDDVNAALATRKPEAWTSLVHDLVSEPSIPSMILSLKFPLRYYGGATNTTLKMYDGYFRRLFEGFNVNADLLVDLGGGYATSDINRVTGLQLTSLDLLSPDLETGDPDLLLLRKQVDPITTQLLNSSERREYIEKQKRVFWIPWNLLDEVPFLDLLGNVKSYGFVSTSFLTSTVRPFARQMDSGGHPHERTSDTAIRRLVELIALGKDVSLFTIEGASWSKRHLKAGLLRWQNRKLTLVRTLQNSDRDILSVLSRERVLELVQDT